MATKTVTVCAACGCSALKSQSLMKNRSHTEIIYDILKAAENSWINRTRLMYTSFISTEQSREYVKDLLDKDLILFDSDKRLYRTSDKGKKFIQLNEELVAKFGFRAGIDPRS